MSIIEELEEVMIGIESLVTKASDEKAGVKMGRLDGRQ